MYERQNCLYFEQSVEPPIPQRMEGQSLQLPKGLSTETLAIAPQVFELGGFFLAEKTPTLALTLLHRLGRIEIFF
jgi:hypothetical protein